MLDVLIDSLIDSLKILIFVFLANVIIGLLEGKISGSLKKSHKFSPLIGSSVALIPQCGISVVSTDLYIDGHISLGTIISIYIATSDEALPILLSLSLSDSSRRFSFIMLLIIKFIIAVIIGYAVDIFNHRNKTHVLEHFNHECHHSDEHIGCCNHTVEEEKNVHKYLLHPLIHSLKTFLFVFIFTFIFASIMYFIGEENINMFLSKNALLAPIFSILVGFIPNCASSVLLTDLYIMNGINFGSLVSGLIVNSGLGILVLAKSKEHRKDLLIIIPILLIVALIVGYLLTVIGL